MFNSVCICALLCLWGLRFHFGKEYNQEYLSVVRTQAVKGAFVLLVFFSHIGSYMTVARWRDALVMRLIAEVDQTMVAMFLFYSGYGVMESVRKKGAAYVAAMPKKRILDTLFRFDCAVVLFGILAVLRGESLKISQVILSFVGWSTLGNSNWYIFAMLVLYTLTWIAFRTAGTECPLRAIALVFLGTVLYMLILSNCTDKGLYWYDSVLCYMMGMLWSCFAGTTAEVCLHKWIPWAVMILASVAAFGWFSMAEYTTLNRILRNLTFTLVMVLASMRVSSRNPILCWCGKHLFPLYILQRIPMIVLKDLGLAQDRQTLYIAACFVTTVAMVYPFEYAVDWLKKRIVK